jgi:hypothetical protein
MNLTKLLAIILFPLGILTILKATGVYSLDIGYDLAMIGAILMIVIQLMTLFMVHKEYGHEHVKLTSIISFVVFVGVAGYYIVATQISLEMWSPLPLILGVMMFLEGMYAMP